MPVLPLPCFPAKLGRETPRQPAWGKRDPHHGTWLPPPQCTAEGVATAARSADRQMPLPAAATPAPERSDHAREADSPAAENLPHAAAPFRPESVAQSAMEEHPAQHAPSSNGRAPTQSAAGEEGDGASWRVRGRASSYSAPETQQAPAPPPPPRLLVFSGGTAFNSVAGEVPAALT